MASPWPCMHWMMCKKNDTNLNLMGMRSVSCVKNFWFWLLLNWIPQSRRRRLVSLSQRIDVPDFSMAKYILLANMQVLNYCTALEPMKPTLTVQCTCHAISEFVLLRSSLTYKPELLPRLYFPVHICMTCMLVRGRGGEYRWLSHGPGQSRNPLLLWRWHVQEAEPLKHAVVLNKQEEHLLPEDGFWCVSKMVKNDLIWLTSCTLQSRPPQTYICVLIITGCQSG